MSVTLTFLFQNVTFIQEIGMKIYENFKRGNKKNKLVSVNLFSFSYQINFILRALMQN